MQTTDEEFRRVLKAYTAKHSNKETFLLLKELTGETAASEVPSEKWAMVINAVNADARAHQPTDSRWTKIAKSGIAFRKAFGQDA